MFEPEKCSSKPDFSLIRQVQYFVPLVSIFITAITLIENGACVIPEASQEGPLRSFNSYEDVVMFHFNVPKQVLRATWQFAAFMDNSKCPQRKVNIFLKWGSYPVISVNNSTYPTDMYIDQNDTVLVSTTTAFEPKSMTIVPIYSPKPGDWFVGAFLSHWDENVHQKGLGHECRYSLGSVAIWSETSGIENIPLGYQKTIRTSETISYYKIYIPMDTWNFQVDIWGCNFILKTAQNFREPCIKNLALKGRALPYYNHSNLNPIGNLSSMDTYTFSELSPFQDSWYYLMVVSNSKINFSIKVTVFDCPVKTLEEVFIQQYALAPPNSKLFDEIHMKDLKNQTLQWNSINKSQIQQNQIFDANKESSIIEDDNNLNSCIPRYKLVRIIQSQIFSGEYLLQGREWLTSWLALTDKHPIITQFDILPLVDIGGTLDININLEMSEILSKQQVNILICISLGRIPKQGTEFITCDNKHMMMELSTNNKLNASLLIPYPQPDTWYIIFQATCYVNKIPVHCEMEEILVSLGIKLRACVFEGSNSCGKYGTCQEIHKGVLYYTACKCFAGHEGWGCTDTLNAISEFSILLTTLTLTLSNLFFIPAIYLAFNRKLYTEALVYFSTMLFSALYHACDQQFTTYCVAKYEALQYCDFFSGILAFWVTLIAIADLSIQYESLCHMIGVIIITFMVESDKTGLTNVLIPLLIGTSVPLGSYIYYCFKMKRFSWPKRIVKLSIGLTLAGFGILIYSLVETESNYKYVHSLWHIIIALSLIFLLPPTKEELVLNSRSINELLNCKVSPDNSIFNIDTSEHDNHLITDIS